MVDVNAPDVWESKGPFNLAGRMLALAVDHNVDSNRSIRAVTYGNGIYT